MKKILSLALVCVMALAICMPAFATTAATPAQDITDSVKFATALEMYKNKIPVVRKDAQFIDPNQYVNGNDEQFVKPDGGIRTITFMEYIPKYFEDQFRAMYSIKENYTVFSYPSIWINDLRDADKNVIAEAKVVYNFEVPKDGTYEFVVVGCAQIKDAQVGKDKNDRGFCLKVDDGNKMQVNISDTQLAFREYKYDYSSKDVEDTNIKTDNGVNSYFYQVGYVYNITCELTKGKHTIEYTNLEYSGEEKPYQGSRLNFMGIYVQEFLTEAELALYTNPTYPAETDEPETSKTKDDQTTKAPTPEKTTPEKTEKAPSPVGTKAPTPEKTTKAPEPEKKGCGSFVGGGAVIVVAILGSALVASKRK